MASEGTEIPLSREADTAIVLTVDDEYDPYVSDESDDAISPPHPATADDEVGETVVVGAVIENTSHPAANAGDVNAPAEHITVDAAIREDGQAESSSTTQQQPQLKDDTPVIVTE